MALNVTFGSCLMLALFITVVTSWTIDLPEVRKYFFEKAKAEKRKSIEDQVDRIYYSNIEGNSKHHEKHDYNYYKDSYAREYGYQSYMEKKVNNIVYNGSVYLEGLRRSLHNYTLYLEQCRSTLKPERRNLTIPSDSWQPPIDTLPTNASNTSRCREATRTSEHVRRLSELALLTTKELQDIAYSRKYNQGDPYDLSQQENELILKLAWFLDRIAHYTGYEPDPKDFLQKPTTTTSTTVTLPPMLVDPSDELKERIMNCLKEKSDIPAVDRCRYSEPLSPMLQALIDMNDNATAIPTMPTISIPLPTQADVTAEPSQELLIASDNRRPTSNFPQTTHVLSFVSGVRMKKRSVLSIPKTEGLKRVKRSDDPLLNFLKYYTKHKVWQGSNLDNGNSKVFETYDVKNQLSHNIHKRAIDKKYGHFPEDPFQDLSNYVKHKPGVNYIREEAQFEKIKASLEKMHKKPMALRKLIKMLRNKRSVKYEQNVDLPRESEDPQGDISYYIKNKPGRNYNNDFIQAVRVRAGLEQIFNTGNIEVVRRYGANYNPLVPAPFLFGVIKTMADF